MNESSSCSTPLSTNDSFSSSNIGLYTLIFSWVCIYLQVHSFIINDIICYKFYILRWISMKKKHDLLLNIFIMYKIVVKYKFRDHVHCCPTRSQHEWPFLLGQHKIWYWLNVEEAPRGSWGHCFMRKVLHFLQSRLTPSPKRNHY